MSIIKEFFEKKAIFKQDLSLKVFEKLHNNEVFPRTCLSSYINDGKLFSFHIENDGRFVCFHLDDVEFFTTQKDALNQLRAFIWSHDADTYFSKELFN